MVCRELTEQLAITIQSRDPLGEEVIAIDQRDIDILVLEKVLVPWRMSPSSVCESHAP